MIQLKPYPPSLKKKKGITLLVTGSLCLLLPTITSVWWTLNSVMLYQALYGIFVGGLLVGFRYGAGYDQAQFNAFKLRDNHTFPEELASDPRILLYWTGICSISAVSVMLSFYFFMCDHCLDGRKSVNEKRY